MAAIDFEKCFDDYVGAHQKVWQHDRSQSLGASSAFGCLRKAWFEKNGAEKDPDYEESWGALQRGDLIEQHFVEPAIKWALENTTEFADLIWGGANQRTLIEGRLSATPDGLVIYADDDALAKYGVASLGSGGDPDHPHACFNFEIKSVDPRVNLKEEKSIHRGQVQVQMGLTREQTTWKPNYAVICYVDASFFDDIEIFVVPFDQRSYDVAKLRAAQVYQIKSPDEIMAEGKIDGGCLYCRFKKACAKVTEAATPGKHAPEANESNTTPAIMEEFEVLIQAERVASAAKKAAEAEHKEASEKLKEWFRDTGVRKGVSGDVTCSISWIKGRKTLDKSLLLADGIDVENYMREGEGYDRLNISEKGPKKADESDLR